MSARPVFDGAPIRSTFSGDPQMADLLSIFHRDLRDREARLLTARATGNEQQVVAIAHQLRAVGGGYGYPMLSEAAGALEQAHRDGAPLDGAFEALRRVISGVLSGAAAGSERAA